MISGLKAALGAQRGAPQRIITGEKGQEDPLCVRTYDCFSSSCSRFAPFFPCTLIGGARQDDVHEQQTAALRHASLFTRAQVHHPAFQLGSYKESLSTNSTGKLSSNPLLKKKKTFSFFFLFFT